MNQETFWELIEQSKRQADSPQCAQLQSLLSALSTQHVLRFHEMFECLVVAADTGELYGAGSLVNGGPLSDDTFLYFRNWLIAQGRYTFEQALSYPDSLGALPEVGEWQAWDEEVAAAAGAVYEQLTGTSVYDATPDFECHAEPVAFNWQDYTGSVLSVRFPVLWSRYGKRYAK